MQLGLASGKLVMLLGVLPMLGVPLIGEWWWIPSIVFAALWFGYLAWRFFWMVKTGLVDGDASDMKEKSNG